MTLPDNFSPAEHLQDTVRRYLNREIRDWFLDLGGDDWDPDVTTARSSLRVACTHLDDDSLLMTQIRMNLFDGLIRNRFQALLSGGTDGIGETAVKVSVQRKAKPQIMLYFLEDLADVEEGYAPVDGRISFRLMDYTTETITETIAQTFANRIRSGFSVSNGFVWKKGREMSTYTDWEKGYQLQLLVKTESEGRRIVEAVLDINNDTPEWAYFNHEENAEPASSYPVIPPLERIYGKNRRTPRRRPVADVRFQYAQLKVIGLPKPVILVDRTGILPAPLAS